MKYTKSANLSGAWIKGSELENGIRAKFVSEARDVQSRFEGKDGNPKMQTVVQVRFEGKLDAYNLSLNRATRDGLIEAFGDESKNWVNKLLRVHTEKVMVSGKRQTALYLVAEGFKVSEDENGYITIVKENSEKDNQEALNEIGSVDIDNHDDVERDDTIDPDDIPF